MQNSQNAGDNKPHLKKLIFLCAVILLAGIGGFALLASMKEPPAEVESGERPLKVEVMAVKSGTVPVNITGYGQVQALNLVKISAEVAGQVVKVHANLETGESIAQGEALIQIDARNYEAAAAQGRAEVAQRGSVLERLQKQAAIDTRRLQTLERNRDLAKAEFDRINDLFNNHSVGTRSGLDRAEQAYNSAIDQADQMAQAVALYPIRIKEARSSLAAARARHSQAKANLERCSIRAPFSGRLTQVSVEQGQYVAPGQVLVVLADDSMLEIQVPLDSRDVRQWLRFDKEQTPSAGAWFGQPEQVVCRVRWTEDKAGHVWKGTLERIVAFDQQTRTVTVAVRVDAKEALATKEGLPLVAGMFCSVEIPGRKIDDSYQIPRAVVSYKNTVFVAQDKRLKTVPVQVARVDGDYAYITGGLKDGDRVIVTRLVDPLENILLEIMPEQSMR